MITRVQCTYHVSQVLTPVRRSARKAVAAGPAPSSSRLGAPAVGSSAPAAAAEVAQKLEATHFCYEGNPVLTPAPSACDGGKGKGAPRGK